MSFATRVRAGEQVFGSFVMELPARACVEALALSGLDFAVLDLEHAPTDLGRVSDLIAAAHECDLAAIVRLQAGDLSTATRVLDMRPDGIMVPAVTSRQDAVDVVSACRYHPRGSRGLAPIVRHRGRYAEVDAATLVIVQVEGTAAVDAARGIAGVDGVDVVFVGPFDLSQALGHPGETGHADVLAAGRTVAAGVADEAQLGVYAASVRAAEPWAEMGATFVAVSTDGQLLLHACRGVTEQLATAPWRRRQEAHGIV